MKKLISVILFINIFFITSLLSSEIINPKILKVALLPDENAARIIKKYQKGNIVIQSTSKSLANKNIFQHDNISV